MTNLKLIYKQIFTNLLENGLRHGGENIKQIISAESGPNHRLVFITLSDSGPGIAKEKSSRIFDPFYTTSERGTGMGLYLVKQLSEANYSSMNYLYLTDEMSSGYFRLTCNITATKIRDSLE